MVNAILESDTLLPDPVVGRLAARLAAASDVTLDALTVYVVETMPARGVATLAVALASLEPDARYAQLALALMIRLGMRVPTHDCPHGSDCPGPECGWVD